jgi:hypothetical protein
VGAAFFGFQPVCRGGLELGGVCQPAQEVVWPHSAQWDPVPSSGSADATSGWTDVGVLGRRGAMVGPVGRSHDREVVDHRHYLMEPPA